MFDYHNYALNYISYIIIFFLSLLSGVVYGAFKRTDRPALRFFALYSVLSWIHCAAYLFQISALTLETKLFWANVKVTALCPIPLVWLSFAYMLTKNKYLNKTATAVLVIIAAINIYVVWNDSSLHLFRESVALYRLSDSLLILKSEFGIWFSTIYVWSLYIPVIISLLIFIAAFMNSGKSGKMQYGVLVLTMFFSIFAGLPQITGMTYIDSYAVSVGISGIIYFILIHKYYVFGIAPLSNSDIIEMVETGILIYDNQGGLVECNSAAKSIFRDLEWAGNITSACEKLSLNMNRLENNRNLYSRQEIVAGNRVYSAKLRLLSGSGRYVDGYIIFITDSTEHHNLIQAQKDRELAEQKSSIIGDIHDNISGSVSVISLIADNAIETGAHDADVLSKIRSIAADTCKEVRFMMNTYERSSFTFRDMASDMRSVGNMLTDGTAVDFRIEVRLPNEMKDIEVPLDIYINLIRFFKECVINCVKHSGAKNLDAELNVGRDGVAIALKDNGHGFDSGVKKGRGFKNMNKRISVIGGELSIDGSAGTLIRCHVPVRGVI